MARHVAGGTRAVVAETAPVERHETLGIGLVGSHAEPDFVVERGGHGLSLGHLQVALRPNRAVGPNINVLDFADDAGVVPFPYEAPAFIGMPLVAHLGYDASLCGEIFELVGLPDSAGEGLFAEHVLALGYRPRRNRIVHVVGSGDGHSVDLLVHLVEHYAVVAETGNRRILLIGLGRPFVVHIAERHEFHEGAVFEARYGRAALPAAAHESQAKLGIRPGNLGNAPRRKDHKTARHGGAF